MSTAAELWILWKRVHERMRGSIVAEVTQGAQLTEPDLSVLVQLDGADGSLRQSAIASALDWDRTRLSHHLTRMEERGYISRSKLPNGVEVAMRPAGRRIIEASVPLLEAAAQRHLLAKLNGDDADQLRRILERMLA